MGAEAEANQFQAAFDDAVDQEEVRFDVAVAVAGVFSLERVVTEGGRQGCPCAKQIDGTLDFRPAFAALQGQFVVADEAVFENRFEHGAQSGMASMKSSISRALAKGPYEGSFPSISRSRMARVSALGISRLAGVPVRRLALGFARKGMVAVEDMAGLVPLSMFGRNIGRNGGNGKTALRTVEKGVAGGPPALRQRVSNGWKNCFQSLEKRLFGG